MLGRGRLGTSLARALKARLLPGRQVGGEAFPAGAIVFVAVPDQALEAVAGRLARQRHQPGVAFVHLSGALGLEVLEPLRASGQPVGSFHPLQSFPVVRPATAFKGSMIAVEASDPKLERQLTGLAIRLRARPRLVPAGQRSLYHAAAVMASNYLVALAAQSAQVLVAAGWSRSDALAALLPLMSGVLRNLEREGLPQALIGPIRRGDPDTVKRQLAALDRLASQPDPGRASANLPAGTYRMLGLAALELAREAGLDDRAARRIAEALTRSGSDQEVTDP